jgi:hypothetical protein
VGQFVQCKWGRGSSVYAAVVTAVHDDGTFDVYYHDNDQDDRRPIDVRHLITLE